MDKEAQIKTLIEYFKGCETVTFSMKNIGESKFETFEFKDAIEELESYNANAYKWTIKI